MQTPMLFRGATLCAFSLLAAPAAICLPAPAQTPAPAQRKPANRTCSVVHSIPTEGDVALAKNDYDAALEVLQG